MSKKTTSSELKLLYKKKRWSELIVRAESHLKKYQNDFDAWLYLAEARFEQKSFLQAIQCLEKAITLKSSVDVYFFMARCYDEMKSPFMADHFYEQATLHASADLKDKILLYRLVNLYNNSLFKKVKEIFPTLGLNKSNFSDVFFIILVAAYEQTNEGEVPDDILKLAGGYITEQSDLSSKTKYLQFLISVKKFDKAIQFMESELLLSKKQDMQLYFYILGCIKRINGDFSAAKEFFEKCLQLDWHGLACDELTRLMYYQMNQRWEAIKIIESNPEHINHSSILANLALFYSYLPNQLNKSIEISRNLLQRKDIPPHERKTYEFNFSLALLTIGDLSLGWSKYELRNDVVLKRKFHAKKWEGEDISDKSLMIWSEQGVGDHFLFASCFADLLSMKTLPQKIIFEAEPRLMTIFQRTFPEIEIRKDPRIKENLSPYIKDYEYHTGMGSLPKFFRKSIDDFNGNSFLKTNPSLDLKWKKRLSLYGDTVKIGIAWRSGFSDYDRNIFYLHAKEVAFILKSFSNKKITWVNLQYGDCDNDLDQITNLSGVKLLSWADLNLKDDFDDVASLIKNLDLVISAGIAVQNLAAAVGKDTWTFDHHPTWTMLGQESRYPWFDSVRMYQVVAPNLISNVIPAIVNDLNTWFDSGHKPSTKTRILVNSNDFTLDENFNTDKLDYFLSFKNAEISLAQGNSQQSVLKKCASLKLYNKLSKLKDFFDQEAIILGGLLDKELSLRRSLNVNNDFYFSGKKSDYLFVFLQRNFLEILPENDVTPYLAPKFYGKELCDLLEDKLGHTVSCLALRDRWCMSYDAGPMGSCLNNPEAAKSEWLALLKGYIEKSHAKRIVLCGIGDGARAAFEFAEVIKPIMLLAISPQFSTDLLYRNLPDDSKSYKQVGYKWLSRLKTRFEIVNHQSMPILPTCPVHFIVPYLNHFDRQVALELQQQYGSPLVHLLPGREHAEVDNEMLSDLIHGFL